MSPQIHVETEGQQDILRALAAFRLGAIAEVKEAVQETAEATLDGAKSRAPVDAGDLRESLRVIYRQGGLSATVGTGYYIARFVEFGTARHTIPRKTKKGKVVLKIGDRFAMSATHPGQPARPFLTPSYAEQRPKYIGRIREALEQAGRRAAV
jgi:HK97 gp10 family phage protein